MDVASSPHLLINVTLPVPAATSDGVAEGQQAIRRQRERDRAAERLHDAGYPHRVGRLPRLARSAVRQAYRVRLSGRRRRGMGEDTKKRPIVGDQGGAQLPPTISLARPGCAPGLACRFGRAGDLLGVGCGDSVGILKTTVGA
jgi:hypothetical protein